MGGGEDWIPIHWQFVTTAIYNVLGHLLHRVLSLSRFSEDDTTCNFTCIFKITKFGYDMKEPSRKWRDCFYWAFSWQRKRERTRHLRQRTETETKCRNGKKTKKVTQMLYHPIIYSLVGAWVWFHTGLVRTSSVNSWRRRRRFGLEADSIIAALQHPWTQHYCFESSSSSSSSAVHHCDNSSTHRYYSVTIRRAAEMQETKTKELQNIGPTV